MSNETRQPEVDFDCDDRDTNFLVWYAFWDSTRSWLAERGYTLYDYGYHWGDEDIGEVTFCAPKTSTTVGKVEYPFTFLGGDSQIQRMSVPPLSGPPLGRIAFAQDVLHRHVALKLVKDNSQEYKIARHLNEERSLLSLECFNGVLPPIDLLRLGNHWILVMPRWGNMPVFPWFSTIREILDFMSYLLKGLSFLHKNNIVHRDIKIDNVLVNHFGTFTHDYGNEWRTKLRRDGQLIYSIIDFDISIIFPSTATSSELRLPYKLSWDGTSNQPYDTRQGELDYDPFAFDVGCLGVLFCDWFHEITPIVPMLAPLMDQMTTRDIHRRFTASQALEFLEGFITDLTPKQLQAHAPPQPQRTPFYEDFDRWKYLPTEFVRKWGHLREPKPSYRIRLLRHICDYDWGRALVQCVRRAFRFLGITTPASLRRCGQMSMISRLVGIGQRVAGSSKDR